MAEHAAQVSETKVVLDPQDPIPESNWIPRRLLIASGVIIGSAGIAYVLFLIGQLGKAKPLEAIEALVSVAHWILALMVIDRILYLVAPSAEQVTKMFATLSAWKNGITFRSTATATTPDGGKVTATQASGPSAPASPPPPAAPAPQGPPE
jgi:hypothetical protein